MTKIAILLLFCLTPVILTAQESTADEPSKPEVTFPDTAGFLASDAAGPEERHKRSRYLFRAGMDILAGGSESSTSPRFYMVHGHRFNPHFSAGIGIGYTSYNEPMSMIPVFIDLTYRFSNQNPSVTPIINLKTGYNYTTRNNNELHFDEQSGGLLFNPAFGFEFSLGRNAGFLLSTGYNIDNSSYQEETWGNRTVVNHLSFRRLSVGAGIVF